MLALIHPYPHKKCVTFKTNKLSWRSSLEPCNFIVQG